MDRSLVRQRGDRGTNVGCLGGCLIIVCATIFFVFLGSLSAQRQREGVTMSAQTPPPSKTAAQKKEDVANRAEHAKMVKTLQAARARQEKKITMTPFALVGAYTANEVAADEEYKGHPLVVTGEVTKIGKGIDDTPYITLASGDMIREVQCMFGDGHKKELVKLIVGCPVTVQGECQGLMGNVILSDCKFVSK